MNMLQRAWSAIQGEDPAAAVKRTLIERGMDGAYGFPRVPWEWSVDGSWQGPNGSGTINVTPSAALTHDGVWACVRALSEDIASLSLMVYRRSKEGKKKADDHPLYEVLHDFANPDMTAFQWRETMMGHVLLWGNCYSEKVYDRAGRLQLWPIPPDRMTVHWDADGRKAYTYTDPVKGRVDMDPDSVFHVPGLGFDGLSGYSVVRMASATIREGLAARSAADAFWKRGLKQSVRWEVPESYSDPQRSALLKAENDNHGSAANAYRDGILPPGVKPHILTMPMDDAQFLESRQANRNLVAAWFRIPPDKIGDLTHATYSNIEQQDINYAKYSVRPWCARFETAIRLQLMRDDREHFAEFLLDSLLRGDSLARATSNNIQFRAGVLSQDEWRAMENRNPWPEGAGDGPMVSADMVPMDDAEMSAAVALARPPEPPEAP